MRPPGLSGWVHPAPHSRSPEARPPLPSWGKHGGPRPGADPVLSPAGSAQPPRLLGLLLRLTAARALRQPPAPPRYVTASRLPRRGGGRGTRSIGDSSDEQRVSVHSPDPGACRAAAGVPGVRHPPPVSVGGSHAYRGEQLRSGDGRAIAVQFDATSQVKVADLHWGDLGRGGKAWSVTPPGILQEPQPAAPWRPQPCFQATAAQCQVLSCFTPRCAVAYGGCVCPWQDSVFLCVPGRTWGVCVCIPGRTLLHSPPQESPHCAHPSPGSTPCTHPSCSPLTWSRLSHRIFSGFRSLCAIPGGKRANEGKNPPPTRLL